MGVILLRQGQYDMAIESFTNGLLIDPRHVGARYNRALCFSRSGNFVQAIHEYEKLLRLNPHHTSSLLNVSRLLLRQEKNSRSRLMHYKTSMSVSRVVGKKKEILTENMVMLLR